MENGKIMFGKFKVDIKKVVLDKTSKKRRWRLDYTLMSENYWLSNHVEFREDTHYQALDRALKILKKSARSVRAPETKGYTAMLFPRVPLPGDDLVTTEELYRLKDNSDSIETILKTENPQDIFVRGYGPEVFNELMGY